MVASLLVAMRAMQVWHLETKSEIAALRGHQGWVWCIDFSRSGHLLASGGLWLPSLLPPISLPHPPSRAEEIARPSSRLPKRCAAAHAEAYMYMHVQDHVCLCRRAGQDMTVRLFSVSRDFEPLYTLTGHSGRIVHVCFSPNDSLLATTSADCSAMLWHMKYKDTRSRFGRLHVPKLLHCSRWQSVAWWGGTGRRTGLRPPAASLSCGCDMRRCLSCSRGGPSTSEDLLWIKPKKPVAILKGHSDSV